jgi:hypothetical protein
MCALSNRVVIALFLFLCFTETVLSQTMTVTGFSPHSGEVGSLVTITGSNFGSEPQQLGIGAEILCGPPDCNPTVWWGVGVPLQVVSWTDNLIQAQPVILSTA